MRERWNDRARNAKRHKRVVPLLEVDFYCEQRRRGARKNAAREHICAAATCGLAFKNATALAEHKRDALHRTPRKRKATAQVHSNFLLICFCGFVIF